MRRRFTHFVTAAGLFVTLAALAACGSAAAAPSGQALYGSCVSCHGTKGEGTALIGAPGIAGLPTWYVTLQLERFQTGLRGQHPDDAEGLRMRAMSKQMMSKAEVQAVAGYVSSLPAVTNATTLAKGDPTVGQGAYTVCTACHGDKGQGNEQVKAPPLAGQDDWYTARQLRKFRSRIRGTAPNDPVGPIMQAMSMTVTPENIDHLAAYLHALPQPPK